MNVMMCIAVLLSQAKLLTGCTGGNFFSTLIEEKLSFLFLRLISDIYIRQRTYLEKTYLKHTVALSLDLILGGWILVDLKVVPLHGMWGY